MARQRDIPDDADEKWRYSQHSQAKHEILHRYLGAWLSILGRGKGGRRWSQLLLVDGFAGRGRYLGGESGSPKIMFDRAVQVIEDGAAKQVLIRCAEPNETNFQHLEEVCADLKHDRVTITPTRETFLDIATRLAESSEGQGPPPPTFVMVDPYGVTGVTLYMLRRLMKIDRLEVLLTFMVRDPGRFLMEPNYEEPLTKFFGSNAWRKCLTAEDRANCLLLTFREIVVPEVAKHAVSFSVYEDERKTILYYLVHLTNSDLGMREMKEAMVKKSGDMTFWPVTVRPPAQLKLEVAEPKPYPTLQKRLAEKYAGRTLSLVEILNDDYPDGAWVESNYRWAIADLEKADPPAVTITRNRLTDSGKPAVRGIKLPDTIAFA